MGSCVFDWLVVSRWLRQSTSESLRPSTSPALSPVQYATSTMARSRFPWSVAASMESTTARISASEKAGMILRVSFLSVSIE